MAPSAQQQVTQFVRREVAENHSQPHTAPVDELIGVVREHVRYGSEAAVFGDHSEAEAVLSLAQAIWHGIRSTHLVGPGGTWQAGKRSASRGSSGQSSH